MIPSVTTAPNSTQQTAATSSNSPQGLNSPSLNSMVSEQTFLQLLVAQLKNQDPLSPQDGTQFVAELAQFSSVEQQLQMRSDLDSINNILKTEAKQQSNSGQSGQTGQSEQTGNAGTSKS
jgi:flagellar basal-body rod modification protein FlgD